MWTFGSPRWSLDPTEDRWIILHCSLALIELSGISRDVSELQLFQFSLFTLIILEFTLVKKMLAFWDFSDFSASIFGGFFRQFFIMAHLRSFNIKTWRYTSLCTFFVGIISQTYD
jgi:hypothetical protein